MAGGDGDQPIAAQMQGRRQRGGEAYAAVSVPGVADPDGGEDQRQRSGGQHMVEGQKRPLGPPFRSLPGLDVPALDPGDRMSRRPLDRGYRDRVEPASCDVVRNARQNAAILRFGAEDPCQMAAQRRSVDQTADLGSVTQPARGQVQEPANDHAAQRPAIVAEDVIGRQVQPDPAQILRRLGRAARMRSEEGGVDRTGGDSRQDIEVELRHPRRQVTNQPDLVGRPRSASGEDEADPWPFARFAGLRGVAIRRLLSRHLRVLASWVLASRPWGFRSVRCGLRAPVHRRASDPP